MHLKQALTRLRRRFDCVPLELPAIQPQNRAFGQVFAEQESVAAMSSQSADLGFVTPGYRPAASVAGLVGALRPGGPRFGAGPVRRTDRTSPSPLRRVAVDRSRPTRI